MKASELIVKLGNLMEAYGDREIAIENESEGLLRVVHSIGPSAEGVRANIVCTTDFVGPVFELFAG